MKILKSLILLLIAASVTVLISCDNDDDVSDSLVNFEEELYDRSTDDLSAFDIELSIEPGAPNSSEITLDVTGDGAGTSFNTTPAVSGGQIIIPVEEGATSASFTFTPDEEGIGFDNVEVDFSIAGTGDGLTSGLTTETSVSIFNTKDTGTPIPYSQDFSSCGDGGSGEIPEDWTQIDVKQNSGSTANWGCTTFPNVGVVINPFTPDVSDPAGSEIWLVSPRLNLVDASSASLTFDFDRRFAPTDSFEEDPVDILISTDYNGSNFDNSTWERFTPGFDAMIAEDPGADNGDVTLGPFDISSFTGNVVTVAFVHRAGSPDSFDATIMRIFDFNVE
mgnify:CR=1 FL=1